MLIEQDNYLICKENDYFKMAIFSTVGGREDQQDSAGYDMNDTSGIFIVCDGMGGHSGGKLAGRVAVKYILDVFDIDSPDKKVNDMLLSAINTADNKVHYLSNDDGELIGGGTTAAIVVMKKHELYWLSVGDSRIYVYRNGELVRITQDHTYEVALRENMNAGLISQEFFNQQIERGDALISFVGIGGMPLIDSCSNSVLLQKDDVVLIMTDGLYKNIPDKIIKQYIENFRNPMDSLNSLEMKVRKLTADNDISRDNMTVVLIRIK